MNVFQRKNQIFRADWQKLVSRVSLLANALFELRFGDPDWRFYLLLARDLLSAGKSNAVSDYFSACIARFSSRFYEYQSGQVNLGELPALVSIELETSKSDLGLDGFSILKFPLLHGQ